MSRHRDVRNMDYSEDYDGYDDVYGHSVDDDYYVSPSHRQFMFNRENSRDQPKIGEFIRTEQDIKEEDESEVAPELSELEKAKLESCVEQVKATLGPLSMPKNELINIIISHNFDIEQVTNVILDSTDSQADWKEKDVTNNSSKFFIPRLNGLNENVSPSVQRTDHQPQKRLFNIPSLNKLPSSKFVIPKFGPGENTSAPKNFTVPKINNFAQKDLSSASKESLKFNNLSDLVSNHLSKSLQNSLSVNESAKQVVKISDSLNSLKIVQSPKSEVLSSSSEYQIDLSVALKASPSGLCLPSKSKNELKEETFEIPFVDCEVDVETKTILKCTLDVKDILNLYFQNVKPVSNFGKVLCRTYKRRHRLSVKNQDLFLRKMPRFSFTTPSPDDSIMKHLKVS